MRKALNILLAGAVLAALGGCGGEPPPASARPADTPAAAGGSAGAVAEVSSGEATFKKACVLCHKNGEGGAPKLGDKENWAPRIAQGIDTLHEHSITGFTGSSGVMPPKGGNMSLADEDVKAAVDYMVSQAQ